MRTLVRGVKSVGMSSEKDNEEKKRINMQNGSHGEGGRCRWTAREIRVPVVRRVREGAWGLHERTRKWRKCQKVKDDANQKKERRKEIGRAHV